MATASATFSPVTFTAPGRSSPKRVVQKVNYISGLNSFGGLKAQKGAVANLGLPVCTEQSFANFVCSLKYPKGGRRNGGGGGGGALTSTCNAVAEIFRIAAIMNGLTLVGVAVGFVLLRIEASVEESE